LITKAAYVFQGIRDDLLDIVRMFVEIFGHDDKGQHVGERDLLEFEEMFKVLEFLFETAENAKNLE
jgi:hypothetical protein